MLRAIVFDLDKCLAAPEEAGAAFLEPVIAAIRRAGDGPFDGDGLDAALEDIWRLAFDEVAARHGFSESMTRAGCDAFRALRMPGPLHGYGDLTALYDFAVPLLLVTTGFRAFQESKIDALGIRDRFVEVIVDDLDAISRVGKLRIFEDLLYRHGWPASEVLVVGDNPESEIAAGASLGMPTVQMVRPGVAPDVRARWRVGNLRELRALVDKLNRGADSDSND